jgi:hypothetical protein
VSRLAQKDVAVVAALSGFYVMCRLLYLPGLAAGLAVKNFNNPVFYADRFALPWLYPTDPWASYQRDIYPFLSLVLAVPAMLWKFLQVPPIYPTFAIIALNDLLIVLAVYWLSRALSFDCFVSVAAGMFAVVSQALSWSLAGYVYLGHDNGYAGSFVIPFAIGVIPSLIQRRVGTALILTALATLIYPPWGVMSLAVVACWLWLRGERLLWRRAVLFLPWPLAALVAVIAVQVIVGATVIPMSHAEDRDIVMANGHFVPLWTQGHPLASPYLGFFMWTLLSLVAYARWFTLTKQQREPIVCLFGLVLASFAAWLLAYRMEWLLPLRTVPFRNSQYLTVVWLPFVIAHLFNALRGRGPAVAVAAGLLVVLLVVDRGTAWVLPMVLPAMLVLALDAWGPHLGFTPAAIGQYRGGIGRIWPIVATTAMAALVAVSIDVVFDGGATASIAARLDASGRVAALFNEAARRLRDARLEVVLLVLVAVPAAWLVTSRRRIVLTGGAAAVALTVFMFTCVALRSVETAVAWTSGEAASLEQIEQWAKSSTPSFAKFVFFELDDQGNQLSWHTLAQRGTATLLYTHQKAYSADRRLTAIDDGVTALYRLDRAEVAENPAPYDVLQLYRRYQQFDLEDFLRVGHLSGSNFVVLRRSRALDLPVAFRNASFTAYRLPAQFGATSVVIADMGRDGVRVRWATAEGKAPVQLFAEFREPAGMKSLASTCCFTLDRPSGDVVVPLPPRLPAGRYHPAIGIRDIATGADVTAVADRAGVTRASWEYLDVQ